MPLTLEGWRTKVQASPHMLLNPKASYLHADKTPNCRMLAWEFSVHLVASESACLA